MEENSISKFMNDLFCKSKSQEKINAWAKYFIDQEFDTIDDLTQISDETWKSRSMTDNIPIKILEDIRKRLRENHEIVKFNLTTSNDCEQIFNQNSNCSNSTDCQDPKEQNSNINKITSSDTSISQDDIEKIAEFLNLEFPHEKIVKFLGARVETPRGNAILTRIKLLKTPPKAPPTNSKRIDARTTGEQLPLYHYVGKKSQFKKYFTLLLIGETGSGKTTLLDAFVNYLNAIEFTDNWRWKLVDETHLNHLSGGESKTSEMVTYYINDHQNKFNVRIIDTPGFGDTKGINVDDQITYKFEALFKEISEIDYILLTIKSTETRLKAGSKYVYDRVQQIFGKDAKDRFILMCTFADGKPPLCLDTIKDFHFEKYFTFNNSALYSPSHNADVTTKFFWKMAMESVKHFLTYIIERDSPPLSLNLSKQNLEQRNYLLESINSSQIAMRESFEELENAKINYENIRLNKKKIEDNGSYTQQESRTRYISTDLNDYYQLCQNCQTTCCQACKWPAGNLESQCTYFNNGNNCPKCVGKCPKSAHIRQNKLVVKETYSETVTLKCKKDEFDKGQKNFNFFKALLKGSVERIENSISKTWKSAQEIKNSIKKLEEIALQPKLFTNEEFYNQMIKQEEEKREKGWQQRVEGLKQILNKSKLLQNISNANDINSIFPEIDEFKKRYEQINENSNDDSFKENSNCLII